MVFAFTKFHQYVYGKEVVVESDHKPLEMIAKKALAAAPPRLQHMLLRLQQYSFHLQFKPGKDIFWQILCLVRTYLRKEIRS